MIYLWSRFNFAKFEYPQTHIRPTNKKYFLFWDFPGISQHFRNITFGFSAIIWAFWKKKSEIHLGSGGREFYCWFIVHIFLGIFSKQEAEYIWKTGKLGHLGHCWSGEVPCFRTHLLSDVKRRYTSVWYNRWGLFSKSEYSIYHVSPNYWMYIIESLSNLSYKTLPYLVLYTYLPLSLRICIEILQFTEKISGKSEITSFLLRSSPLRHANYPTNMKHISDTLITLVSGSFFHYTCSTVSLRKFISYG